MPAQPSQPGAANTCQITRPNAVTQPLRPARPAGLRYRVLPLAEEICAIPLRSRVRKSSNLCSD
jgi:hypothetical protein